MRALPHWLDYPILAIFSDTITGIGLGALADNSKLRFLEIAYSISNEGVEALSNITSLQELVVNHNRGVTDDAIPYIVDNMPSLRKVETYKTGFSSLSIDRL